MKTFTPSEYTHSQVAVDLRGAATPITDQGNVGACVGYSMTTWVMNQLNYAGTKVKLMALDIYDRARAADGILGDDGCAPITALNIAKTEGLLADDGSHWQVNFSKISIDPDSTLNTANNVRMALSEHRYVFNAMDVYGYFMKMSGDLATQNRIDTTNQNAFVFQGRHATVFDGATKEYFITQNSWGESWGYKGFGAVAVTTMANLKEAYVIDSVTNGRTGEVIDFTFTQQKGTICALYALIFDKAPEKSALSYWTGRLEVQTTASVAQDMINVGHAQNVIEAAYHVLGKDKDFDGIIYWNNEIKTHSQGDVMANYLHAVNNYSGADHEALNAQSKLDSMVSAGLDHAVMQQNDVQIVGISSWFDSHQGATLGIVLALMIVAPGLIDLILG